MKEQNLLSIQEVLFFVSRFFRRTGVEHLSTLRSPGDILMQMLTEEDEV